MTEHTSPSPEEVVKQPSEDVVEQSSKDVTKQSPICPDGTCIDTLGNPRFSSTKKTNHYITDEDGVLIFIEKQQFCFHDSQPVTFEEAGPRQSIYFDPPRTKCAIVTCGGICPGINDVIRSIVNEAHYQYGVAATIGIRYGLRGFIPEFRHNVMELTPRSVSSIHEFGGSILGSSRGPQSIVTIVDALDRMNIDILFLIGGVGGMRAAEKIYKEVQSRQLDISIVCIPKTIDNDIHFVSRTFGFNTAVDKATEAIRCAHVEATGAPAGVGLVKVMGRYSGFIATEATLGLQDVNIVLIPESPFKLEGPTGLLSALEERLDRRGHAVIVVAEGAGQHLLPENGGVDASGNPILGDICGLLVNRIKAHFKQRQRPLTLKFIDPSYIIRSIPANTEDSVYCGSLAQNAVHAGMAGKTGLMVSRWHDRNVHVPLHLVTKARKTIDPGSLYWQRALSTTGQSDLES
ncbi:ATP-dependent 6-phosphofructokinase [Desulfovibrio inopinatus]|uniref:ATP-dependent 6-phosphofructokinase n=1 Tax=Desulfovibrio inopinatus TaxID=102109 RepID=UPI00040DCF85|nr:ATP-dependent 6-phosphofructokinase [Desulfovibrio inopinatus]